MPDPQLLESSQPTSQGRTIGLNSSSPNALLLEWSVEAGNRQVLCRFIRASQVSKPSHIGNCLHFLTRPSIAHLLEDWAEQDEDSEKLCKLASDLRGAPNYLLANPPSPPSRRLAEQFRGEVASHQVLLMLAVRRPGNAEIQLWFDSLRLWTLLQAFRLAKESTHQDEFINLIAEKLRLAADNEGEWLALLSKIKPQGIKRSAEALSLELRRGAVRHRGIETGERGRFLLALRKAANGEARPAAVEGFSSEIAEQFSYDAAGLHQSQAGNRQDFTWIPPTIADDDPVYVDQLLAAATAVVSEDASSSERLLSGRGIRLQSAEQLQFLPWSWHKPNPIEKKGIASLIVQLEQSPEVKLQLLAWLIKIATITSTSMRQVLKTPVSDSREQDWAVSSDLASLQKNPSRRAVGWKANSDHVEWIRELGDGINISVKGFPPSLFANSDKYEFLSDIWREVSPGESAETAFNTLCNSQSSIARVTSGMLSGSLGADVFQNSGDSVLAQLLSSNSRSGMGGASAYGSFTEKHVVAALKTNVNSPIVPTDGEKNTAGSELDPLDEALRQSIVACENRIQTLALDPAQWIAHHNAVAIYCVYALLAASGARPVNDPFESPMLFDWEMQRLFVSDKVSQGRTGRLIPLPDAVLRLIGTSYCEHLQLLAGRVKPFAAPLADEIFQLASKTGSKKIPFFFLLRDQPCLSWESVTERALEKSKDLCWPLPANLMRHRLSIRLREQALDPEIIDSILGHSDQGVQTHGADSTRMWSADMAAARHKMENIYQALGFAERVALQSSVIKTWPLVELDELFFFSRAYGHLARKEARTRFRKNARKKASQEIRGSIKGHPPETIEAQAWEKLAIKMLTIDGKRPHPMGDLRYETLVRWQTQLSKSHSLKIKRVFVLDREVESVFRIEGIGCESFVVACQKWLSTIYESLPPSKMSVRHCLALAVFDLVLTCRITSPQLLKDVLRKSNFRLTVKSGTTFLEHHPLLGNHPDAPVTRFRIPMRCASLLNKSLYSTYEIDCGPWELPDIWKSALPRCLSHFSQVGELVRNLADCVQQANYLTRPGLVGGYLAGAIPTSSLPHNAWKLETEGVVPSALTSDLSADAGEDVLESFVNEDRLRSSRQNPREGSAPNNEKNKEGAATFLKGIRYLLTGYRSESGVDTTLARRDLVNALRKQVQEAGSAVSTAIWSLGVWTVFLTAQPRKKDTPYAVNTILRYVSALSQRFIDVGYDFDLLSADSDEITDFYDSVLEIDRDLDITYVVERLGAFHRFMQARFHIDDADWAELDCGSTLPQGSPGTLGQKQYENALEVLAYFPDRCSDEELARAMMLLLTYRFGLRGNDAIGLQVKDFWRDGHTTVIQVQSNNIRRLKRPSSRRTVPLIESLSPHEWAVIERFSELARALSGGRQNFPLFGKDISGSLHSLPAIRERINSVLKAITSDPRTTHHKGRHGFANRIGEALFGQSLRSSSTRTSSNPFDDHVSRLLLGSSANTRRAPWALSRVLGHARPITTFKSYLHLLPVWADTWSEDVINALDGSAQASELIHAVDLDILPYQLWEPTQAAEPAVKAPALVTLSKIAEYLELLRRGAPEEAAARSTKIGSQTTAFFQQAFPLIESRLRLRTARDGRSPLGSLLSQISESEWRRVSAYCHSPAMKDLELEISSLPIRDCLQMVSENRQLLFWKESQFNWVVQFIKFFQFSALDVRVLQTPALHPLVAQWLASIPQALVMPPSVPLRLDGIDDGIPPMQVRHRCAAVVNYDAGLISTGYGLIILWLIFVCVGQSYLSN